MPTHTSERSAAAGARARRLLAGTGILEREVEAAGISTALIEGDRVRT